MTRLARLVLLRLWRFLSRWRLIERVLTQRLNQRFLVGVLGIFADESGRVLLLDHGRYRRRFAWGLPGGWHEGNETLTQTIAREMKEETGLDVTVDRFFHIITRFPYPRIEFIVAGRLHPGAPKYSAEISGHRFVGPDDDVSTINPRHRRILEWYFAGTDIPLETALSDLAADDPIGR